MRTSAILLSLWTALDIWHPPVANAADVIQCNFRDSLADGNRKLPRNDWRPPSIGSFDSAKVPITVHWQKGVKEEYAKQILTYAEDAWDVEVNQMKFRAPLPDHGIGGSDNLDIYVVTTLPHGVGGYTGFSDFADATQKTVYGYINISNILEPAYIRGVVAHEFFHTIQMAYTWWEEAPLLEGTATWVVDHVVPDEKFYWHYFPYFNSKPYHSLNFTSQADAYQYGNALWFTYLDEHLGRGDGTVVRQLFETLAKLPVDYRSHYFETLKAQVGGDAAMQKIYAEFGFWRVALGSREDHKHFAKGADWNKSVDPTIEFNAPPGLTTGSGQGSNGIEPYGQAFFSVARDNLKPVRSHFTFAGTSSGDYSIGVILRSPTGNSLIEPQPFKGGNPITLDLEPASDVNEVLFAISYFGDANTDLDLNRFPAQGYVYQLDNTTN